MIKMSKFTPGTADLVQALIGRYFSEDDATVVAGELDVSTEFTQLPGGESVTEHYCCIGMDHESYSP
ncbi:hypothetical protein ACTL6P_01585 [Endozoicomonas acroporae]|uniref:hypothetical protein n=1 Tax=Endozoicomonas acroporae TaxID=1701104 RepID=UPI000C78F8BE|nr:hypothetical protein [Endozoicomonas acroporae]